MNDEIVLTVQDDGPSPRQVVLHDRTQCVIGRSSDSDVRIASPLVSRCHCEVEVDLPLVTVRDLGSRNGTYVNNTMIGRRDPRRPGCAGEALSFGLRPGDVIHVGPVTLSVEWAVEWADESAHAEAGELVLS